MKVNRRTFIQQAAMLSVSTFGAVQSAQQIAGTVAGKRIGIIGLDTSHCIAFTKTLNAEQADPVYKDFRVVAAYPYGSQTIVSSARRIPGYRQEIQQLGVSIVPSIRELCRQVDYILLETNDGRLHLEQAQEVIDAGKALFVDKPLAASYADGARIVQYAAKQQVPFFSASSLRWADHVEAVAKGECPMGQIVGADTYSPAPIEATHPDLFWYGVHGVEMLYAVLGQGCTAVRRVYTPTTDVVVGQWPAGCLGTFRGMRVGNAFGGIVFGTEGTQTLGGYNGYNQLLKRIIRFFDTKQVPVSPQETLETLAFMEAADISKKRGGEMVELAELMN